MYYFIGIKINIMPIIHAAVQFVEEEEHWKQKHGLSGQ